MNSNRVLVLVHPGSACGSANYNIGRSAAASAREGLVRELEAWRGGVVVIDGELSDELPQYPALNEAIAGALLRAAATGHVAIRREGDDPGQVDVIKEIAGTLRWKDGGIECTVTGAWLDPSDGSGCVGSVVKALESIGVNAVASESAVCVEAEEIEAEDPAPALARAVFRG